MENSTRPILLDHILKTQDERPLVAYPRGRSVADFERFTSRDLDVLVERACKHYHGLGLDPVSNY